MTNQWYYSNNNEQQGPVSSEQLKELAVSCQVSLAIWFGEKGWTNGPKLGGSRGCSWHR